MTNFSQSHKLRYAIALIWAVGWLVVCFKILTYIIQNGIGIQNNIPAWWIVINVFCIFMSLLGINIMLNEVTNDIRSH